MWTGREERGWGGQGGREGGKGKAAGHAHSPLRDQLTLTSTFLQEVCHLPVTTVYGQQRKGAPQIVAGHAHSPALRLAHVDQRP